MALTGPETREEIAAGERVDPADVQQFVLLLGSALTASGEAVHQIQDRLQGVAAAYGFPRARIGVLPTLAVVSLTPGRATTIEQTHQLRGNLRLDQTAAIFDLMKEAAVGKVDPKAGSARVHAIIAMGPRFGIVATVLGHVALTVGICLVLQPTLGDVWLAALFGALVAFLKMAGLRWGSAQMVMPVGAAFVVSAITLLLAKQGWADADLRALIAPLVTFLPGSVLTIAVVELAAGEMITGASRLVSGTLQLLLLAFGIVAAAQVVGLPTGDHLATDSSNVLGWWAPWLGVLVFGLGAFVYFSAPPRTAWWLLLVLFSAWTAQKIGSEALGGYLSGFVGGLVMTLVAYAVERRPTGPAALVSFLPGFWLLVPGALGLIGVTEYIGADRVAGIQDFLGTVGAIIAIALGVLCAYPINESLSGLRKRLDTQWIP